MAKATVISDTKTEEHKDKVKEVGKELIRVACSMQNGITFTDIASAPGERFSFPGINDDIRNNPNGHGILVDAGSSVCVGVPKDIWEEIKNKYGSAHCFTSEPPFLRELKSDADYKAAQDELKEVRTGAEPATQAELDKAQGK